MGRYRVIRQMSLGRFETTKRVLAGVGDVKEPILVLVLLVDAAHQRGCWGKDLIDEDEDGLLRGQLNTLADNINELPDRQVRWHQILLFIDGGDVALLYLFADDRNTVTVLLSNSLGLGLALLEGVLVLELASHLGGDVSCLVWMLDGDDSIGD